MFLSQYGKQVSFTLPALKQIKILIPNGNQLSSPFTYAYPFNLGNTMYKKQALTFYIQVSLKHKVLILEAILCSSLLQVALKWHAVYWASQLSLEHVNMEKEAVPR